MAKKNIKHTDFGLWESPEKCLGHSTLIYGNKQELLGLARGIQFMLERKYARPHVEFNDEENNYSMSSSKTYSLKHCIVEEIPERKVEEYNEWIKYTGFKITLTENDNDDDGYDIGIDNGCYVEDFREFSIEPCKDISQAAHECRIRYVIMDENKYLNPTYIRERLSSLGYDGEKVKEETITHIRMIMSKGAYECPQSIGIGFDIALKKNAEWFLKSNNLYQ
jgi:hypothetical protein